MAKVRFGVVGLGNMGTGHARWCATEGKRTFSLGAVCDVDADRAKAQSEQYNVPHFTDAFDMIDSGDIDAVIIAVPHYWHAPIAVYAARTGLHVLCEKPLESRVGPARMMVEECRKNNVAFGAVLQHRTRSIMRKAKQLIDRGDIGEVFRVQLVCSSWFRTQAYYDSGAWRGTWDGEGGGVLINQAPHHLDLFQWIGGMPNRIKGSLSTRAHDIEVEDTANFICEYDDGKIGYIYATTAEEPGYEQLMVCGDKGVLVVEKGELKVGTLKLPVSKHIQESKKGTAGGAEQGIRWKSVPLPKTKGGQHVMIVDAFAKHIQSGKEQYAPGDEAINELELSNAMYVAGFKDKTVDLPVDEKEIDRLIKKLEKERATGKGGGMRGEADKALGVLKRGSRPSGPAAPTAKKKTAKTSGKKRSKKTTRAKTGKEPATASKKRTSRRQKKAAK
ncbi:MAG: Gfo/Idh/MocA family protein [Planctomycetota bacterium]